METPSSTRRITRSQAMSAVSNSIPLSSRKVEESDKSLSKSRQRNGKQQDRSALIDITNDSPIGGLAKESLETPLSSVAKQKSNRSKMTPGSGEALLRGQVKNLLQKVEEEAVLSKLSLEARPFLLQGFGNSPSGLLAPTPANTPQVSDLSSDQCVNNCSPVIEEQSKISQVVNDIFDGKKQENLVTRSLLFDFTEKSETSESSECSSVLTYQEKSSTDDDDASVWSIQVNASSTKDEDEEEAIEEDDYDYVEENDYDEEEVNDEEDGGLVDELCEGISNMCVNEKTKFLGKHIRFVYNSDDEIVAEEKEETCESDVSPGSVLRLKGLPAPKGKHLRFPEEEEELN